VQVNYPFLRTKDLAPHTPPIPPPMQGIMQGILVAALFKARGVK